MEMFFTPWHLLAKLGREWQCVQGKHPTVIQNIRDEYPVH